MNAMTGPRRTTTSILAAAAATLVLVLAGCGDDTETGTDPTTSDTTSDAPTSDASSDTSSEAPTDSVDPDLPDCTDVWQAGEAVPKRYQGCVADGAVVKAERQRCSSGQVLVTFEDAYYGVEGGPVNEESGGLDSSDSYRDARRACLG